MTLTISKCAYCGKTRCPGNRGHVISRNLYPAHLSKAKRILVPECLDCKAHFEEAENQFRNIMVMLWDQDRPVRPVRDDRYDAMQRSFLRFDGPKHIHTFLNAYRFIDVDGRQSLVLKPLLDDKFVIILKRIMRGLSHHHKIRSCVPESCIRCEDLSPALEEELKGKVKWEVIAPNFFKYAHLPVSKSDIESRWLLQFSKHLKFVCDVRSEAENAPILRS